MSPVYSVVSGRKKSESPKTGRFFKKPWVYLPLSVAMSVATSVRKE